MTATRTPTLATGRLTLTPLQVSDAGDMVSVLAASELYTFTGGAPPRLAELEETYRFQVVGPDRDGEMWHNWIIRLVETGAPVGFVQSTVTEDESDIAWVVGIQWQGNGYATEAARVMAQWLIEEGTPRLVAHIHPDHIASGKVAAAVGLQRTDEIDSDGEVTWALDLRDRSTS